MNVINLDEKASKIDDYWNPRIIGELNGQHVRLVKFQGEFIWHKHENEEELFLVIDGEFEMHFRDRIEIVKKNELIIVPNDVEHKPVANKEVTVLLFEPANTQNTGQYETERTITTLERL